MAKKAKLLWTNVVAILTFVLPDTPTFMRLRGWLYSFAMLESGRNFQVSRLAVMRNITLLRVGNDVYIAPGVVINSIGLITISSRCLIGFNSVIVSGAHQFDGAGYGSLRSKPLDIHISAGAWVASNCTVCGGARIGNLTVVAANSVVVSSTTLEPNSLYGGVPAKFIKRLDAK